MDKPSAIDLTLYIFTGLVTVGGIVVPMAWEKHKAAAIWGLFTILVLIELGGVLYWQKLELASAPQTAGPTRAWKVFPIRDESGNLSWNYNWTDVAWIGPEGWLCGTVHEGGGSGDVGRGILLRTINIGVSWTEIKKEAFDSGRGHFDWGTRPYEWQEVGPIKACRLFRRELGGGKRRIEGWLAAKTGIYFTSDAGQTWKRSTPPPDDRDYSPPFAHFENLADVELFSEIYAVGWQGIAHRAYRGNIWTVQKGTGYYALGGVSVFGGSENRDVWAAGMAGQDELGNRGDRSHGAIYHLRWPADVWDSVDLSGVSFQPSQSFADILAISHELVFAVGQQGLFVRGSEEHQEWKWKKINVGTEKNLTSITYDGDQLWITGDQGTLLWSADLGETWKKVDLDDGSKTPVSLRRIRFSDGVGWIVADKAVYRSEKVTSP
jgi:photosystem II stability/assembly factor-like uncharacterized protein